MNVVLDTNILVSAAWSPGKTASDILSAAFSGQFSIYYDLRIIEEYFRVMHYSKFGFEDWEIDAVLVPIVKYGNIIAAKPIPNVVSTDESDRKFYEVAKTANAILVTGNLKHYPSDGIAMGTADFHALLNRT